MTQQLPDWLEAMVPDVARALCVADGFNPDDDVIAGQAAAFENFGPRWQANERSEGTLGGRNYVTEARAALAEAAPKIVELVLERLTEHARGYRAMVPPHNREASAISAARDAIRREVNPGAPLPG